MEAVSKLSIQSALPADVYALLADFCDRHPHEHVWTSVTLLLARTGYLLGSKARVSVAGFDWEDNLKFSDHETWEIEKWCPAISEVLSRVKQLGRSSAAQVKDTVLVMKASAAEVFVSYFQKVGDARLKLYENGFLTEAGWLLECAKSAAQIGAIIHALSVSSGGHAAESPSQEHLSVSEEATVSGIKVACLLLRERISATDDQALHSLLTDLWSLFD